MAIAMPSKPNVTPAAATATAPAMPLPSDIAKMMPSQPTKSAHVNRTVSLGLLGGDDEAIVADVTAAIDLQPDDIDLLSRAYMTRSTAYALLERWEESAADAATVIELQPADQELLGRAHFSHAGALIGQGKFDDATEDLRTTVRLLPDTHEMSRVASAVLTELDADG